MNENRIKLTDEYNLYQFQIDEFPTDKFDQTPQLNLVQLVITIHSVHLKIATLRTEVEVKQEDLRDTQSKADMQLLESRSYMDKQERDHQKEVDRLQLQLERQLRLHSDLIGKIIKRRAERSGDASPFRPRSVGSRWEILIKRLFDRGN